MNRRTWLALALAFTAVPAIHSATLPRKAPPLKIEMAAGPALQLSQYKGKPVVIAFILTTCSHCQNTTALLIGMQREYGDKGLQVLAVSVDTDGKKTVPGFARQLGTNFPVGYISQPTVWLDFLQHPTIQTPRMPMLAFIDRSGTIRFQHDANDERFFAKEIPNMRSEIEAILKPAGGDAKKTPAKTASK
jgi:peroxiredoxin